VQDVITNILNELYARLFGLFDFFTDPFWYWLGITIVIVAAVSAVVYFFSSYFTWLRPVGGVILLIVTLGLYAYTRGAAEARAHDKRRAPPLKPAPKPSPPATPAPFNWWQP